MNVALQPPTMRGGMWRRPDLARWSGRRLRPEGAVGMAKFDVHLGFRYDVSEHESCSCRVMRKEVVQLASSRLCYGMSGRRSALHFTPSKKSGHTCIVEMTAISGLGS